MKNQQQICVLQCKTQILSIARLNSATCATYNYALCGSTFNKLKWTPAHRCNLDSLRVYFCKLLDDHDYFYTMADDNRAYDAGCESMLCINLCIEVLVPDARELYRLRCEKYSLDDQIHTVHLHSSDAGKPF